MILKERSIKKKRHEKSKEIIQLSERIRLMDCAFCEFKYSLIFRGASLSLQMGMLY